LYVPVLATINNDRCNTTYDLTELIGNNHDNVYIIPQATAILKLLYYPLW